MLISCGQTKQFFRATSPRASGFDSQNGRLSILEMTMYILYCFYTVFEEDTVDIISLVLYDKNNGA